MNFVAAGGISASSVAKVRVSRAKATEPRWPFHQSDEAANQFPGRTIPLLFLLRRIGGMARARFRIRVADRFFEFLELPAAGGDS